MQIHAGDHPINNHSSCIEDEIIHGIDHQVLLCILRKSVHRPEDGTAVIQQTVEDIVEIGRILEEHKHGRQDHTQPQIKEKQQNKGVEQEQEIPCKSDIVDEHKDNHDKAGDQKIQCRGYVFRQWEQPCRQFDLVDDAAVEQERLHSLCCCIGIIAVDQHTNDEVCCKVRHIPAEHVLKDQHQDEEFKQRIEYTPKHTKGRFLVFLDKVPFDQP